MGNQFEIEGRSAVITGAASGIGRALALALAARSGRILLVDIDAKGLESVVDAVGSLGGQAIACPLDLLDRRHIETMAQTARTEFGTVDMVFANAGVGASGMLAGGDANDPVDDWVIDLNLRSTIAVGRAFAQLMRAQCSAGHICFTGSVFSVSMPQIGAPIYAATKHALLAIAEHLRAELSPLVGVSIACPDVVSTRLWESQRNRPLSAGGPAAGSDLSEQALTQGDSPDRVAAHMLDAISQGEFYLFPHANVGPHMERRYQEMLGALHRQRAPALT